MTDILMILFLLFVLSLIVLDISMIISLIKPGDERKQMVVWKASAYTLLAAVGAMVINIIHNIIQTDAMQINPFTQLAAAAIIYFFFLAFRLAKELQLTVDSLFRPT